MKRLAKIVIPVLVILGLVLVAGCSSVKESPISAPAPPGERVFPETGGISKNYAYEAASSHATAESDAAEIDRKIVKNGSMVLEVNDITAAIDGVAAIARDMSGYVVYSKKGGGTEITYGQISIRVPSDRFDEAFDRLRKLAVNVPNESTNSRDVTEEYTDLQAQLRNKEAEEAAYLEIFKQAEKVEDILAVQQALSNVRGQIEQLKGRIQYIERTSDSGLIDVSLQKVKPIGGTAWSARETLT